MIFLSALPSTVIYHRFKVPLPFLFYLLLPSSKHPIAPTQQVEFLLPSFLFNFLPETIFDFPDILLMSAHYIRCLPLLQAMYLLSQFLFELHFRKGLWFRESFHLWISSNQISHPLPLTSTTKSFHQCPTLFALSTVSPLSTLASLVAWLFHYLPLTLLFYCLFYQICTYTLCLSSYITSNYYTNSVALTIVKLVKLQAPHLLHNCLLS